MPRRTRTSGAGTALARFNALRHGITSSAPVIPGGGRQSSATSRHLPATGSHLPTKNHQPHTQNPKITKQIPFQIQIARHNASEGALEDDLVPPAALAAPCVIPTEMCDRSTTRYDQTVLVPLAGDPRLAHSPSRGEGERVMVARARAGAAGFALRLAQQLPQDKRQDAAVVVVVDLDGGVDAADSLERRGRAGG